MPQIDAKKGDNQNDLTLFKAICAPEVKLYTIEKTDTATNEAMVGIAKLNATSGIVPVLSLIHI